jgi:hypothetical protein
MVSTVTRVSVGALATGGGADRGCFTRDLAGVAGASAALDFVERVRVEGVGFFDKEWSET